MFEQPQIITPRRFIGIDSVLSEPKSPLLQPAVDHFARHRVMQPERNETDDTRLRPMRQFSVENRCCRIRVKEAKLHGAYPDLANVVVTLRVTHCDFATGLSRTLPIIQLGGTRGIAVHHSESDGYFTQTAATSNTLRESNVPWETAQRVPQTSHPFDAFRRCVRRADPIRIHHSPAITFRLQSVFRP